MSSNSLRRERPLATLRTNLWSAEALRPWLEGGLLFLLLFGGLLFVQFGTQAFVGTDGYYHAKMGWLIRQSGLAPNFPWLPQTILSPEGYYNHHLLYHAYLALFATTDPALDGGAQLTYMVKIASALLPALAGLTFWGLLRRLHISYPFLWALGLLVVSDAFLYRMSMPRAQSASLLVLFITLNLLFTQRYRWLVPVGFLYVWLYNAFPLLLIMAGIYVAALWWVERRFAWQALFYPALGILLGIIINPYFPQNISFILSHLLPKLSEATVKLGNEWRPYSSWGMFEHAAGAFIALGITIPLLASREKPVRTPTFTALLLALAFGLMLLKSRRFVEYFPPFALLVLPLTLQPFLGRWQQANPKLPLRWLVPSGLTLLLLVGGWINLTASRDLIAKAKPADRYAASALWLEENAPDGAAIFQTDWDDFTRLFFYNTRSIYLIGLDPTYLQLADAEKYALWVNITQGDVEAPGRIIAQEFGSQYVFSDLNHDDFIAEAEADPLLEEVFRSHDSVVFQVHTDN